MRNRNNIIQYTSGINSCDQKITDIAILTLFTSTFSFISGKLFTILRENVRKADRLISEY